MQRTTWRLAFLVASLASAGISAAAVLNDRRLTWAAAEAKLAATARLLEEHADRALEAGDRAVQAALDAVGDPAGLHRPDRGTRLHGRLQELVQGNPQIASAWVMDAQGYSIAENWGYPPRAPGPFTERDYFQAHARGVRGLHIGPMAIGPNLRRQRFTLSRPLLAADGGFAGLAAAGINSEYFATIYAEAGLGNGAQLALFLSTGAPLAVWPPLQDAAREVPPLPAGLPPQGPGAMLRAEDDRLVAARSLERFPVVLVVSQPRDELMAAWRERAWRSAAVMAVVLAALLALTLFGLRSARRERELVASLRHEGALLEERVRQRTASLAESERRLRQAMQAGHLGLLRYEPARRRFGWSPEVAAMLGLPAHRLEADAEDWARLLHPEDRPALEAVCESEGACLEFRVIRPDGEGQRWLEWRCALVPGQDAEAPGLEGVLADVTRRREEEQRRILLTREVHHRAKNALAVVQAALRLTPRRDAEAYAGAVQGRVAALARAHTLLAEGDWRGADLRSLLEAEMAPFLTAGNQGTQVALEGPPVTLPASATQPLAMALHELATNAVKHGALSQPGGQIRLRWWLAEGEGLLRLRWAESGGPPPPPQRGRGFGSRVLAGTIQGQLGGSISFDWRPEGLVCDMALPRASMAGLPDAKLAAG